MNTAPSSDFIRFVFDQPENRRIYHSKGWSSCAVGQFFSEFKETSLYLELNKINPEHHIGTDNTYRLLQSLIIPVVGTHLEKSLNNQRWNYYYAQTYGALAKEIEKVFPDETKAALMRSPRMHRALSRTSQAESRSMPEAQPGEEGTSASHRAAAKLCEVPE